MKSLKLISAFAMLVAFVISCVEDNDFDLPNTAAIEPILEGDLISINDVKDAFFQEIVNGPEISTLTFEETNLYVSGFVISTDEAGNFFEELVIQDAAENPKAGIKILLDVGNLFTRYEPGRSVYVKLDGLTIGIVNGVFVLGILKEGNDIDKIPAPLEETFILRSSLVETLVPSIKTIGQLTENDINTLIQLPLAQFTESELGLSFAGEVTDEFDGDRTIESCSEDGGSILFQTSTFSDFKSNTLPSMQGALTAVLSKDFFGEQFALSVRDINDINFNGTRCTPALLDPNIDATTTFAAVMARFEQEGGYAAFGTDEDELIIEGYVVSNDQYGNFFEELIIQNTPGNQDISTNNPRLGLRVYLDRGDLYQTLPVGRKVYIRLNGLAVDEFRGNLTLGTANGSSIGQIPDGLIDDFVIPGEIIADIVPKNVGVNDLTMNDVNTMIQLDNMQFAASQLGLTFAGEATDQFDGERQLESCDETGDIRLFTSTFSSYKSITLPEGVGSITAIYTYDFGGEELILEANQRADIVFNNSNRCDPPIVDCGLANSEGLHILFSENFETQVIGNSISGNGMVNYQEAGTASWESYSSDGTNGSIGISARVGSFMSGDDSTISWLVFPEIDYDAQDGETIRFQTSNSFSDGSTLEILFSSDWDGIDTNIPNATWSILSAAVIVPDDAFFGDFIDSGIVDLSCIEGTGYIAFKYVGSGDEGFDGTYELDEIEIKSN